MTVSTTQIVPTHVAPVVRSFMQRRGIPAQSVRSDGRLTLKVDERYRVHLACSSSGRVALQSDLLTLPDVGAHDALLRLARLAAGMIHRHASTLCIDRERNTVMLQQTVAGGADVQILEDALTDFLNALAQWSDTCRAEAATLLGEEA